MQGEADSGLQIAALIGVVLLILLVFLKGLISTLNLSFFLSRKKIYFKVK